MHLGSEERPVWSVANWIVTPPDLSPHEIHVNVYNSGLTFVGPWGVMREFEWDYLIGNRSIGA